MSWWTRVLVLLAFAGVLLVLHGADAREFVTSNVPGHTTADKGTILVTNQGSVTGHATITPRSLTSITLTIAPGETKSYEMPLDDIGYHIDASDHLLLTQLNPINNAYTNDAYKLMSLGEIGRDYLSFSYDGRTSGDGSPGMGFTTIVATEDRTTVTIKAGSTTHVTLDALELHTVHQGQSVVVSATKPVAVTSGNACVIIGSGACDHISEMLPPTAAAGREYAICSSMAFRATGNDRLRVMATEPGTTSVTVSGHPSITLRGKGSWQEVQIEDDTFVRASRPVLVGQFYADSGGFGDPAYIAHLPVSSFRDERAVHVPVGWLDKVQIAAPSGTTSTIDGIAVGGARGIPGSGYQCSTHDVVDGDHMVRSSAPSSVQVIGIQSYASYWYLADIGYPRPPPPPPSCESHGRAPGTPILRGGLDGEEVSLAWDQVAADPLCPTMGYHVERRATGAWTRIGSRPGTGPFSWEDTLPSHCVPWDYRVVAFNNMSRAASEPRTFVIGDPPGRPELRLVPGDRPGDYIVQWRVDDGGCPLTLQELAALDGWGRVDRTVLDGFTTAWNSTMEDLCGATAIYVRAQNALGQGPWSRTAGHAVPGVTCALPQPDAGDADGDGAADGMDNCEGLANRDQFDGDGDGKGAACDDEAPVAGCAPMAVEHVTAVVEEPDVHVVWHAEGCPVRSFSVVRMPGETVIGTALYHGDGPYTLQDRGVPAGAWVYWVQPGPAPLRQDAVPSNEVAIAPPPAAPTPPVAEQAPGPEAAMPGPRPTATIDQIAWPAFIGVAAGVLLVLVLLLVLVRRRQAAKRV